MTLSQNATLPSLSLLNRVAHWVLFSVQLPFRVGMVLLTRLCWHIWSYTIVLGILLLTIGSLAVLWVQERTLQSSSNPRSANNQEIDRGRQ